MGRSRAALPAVALLVGGTLALAGAAWLRRGALPPPALLAPSPQHEVLQQEIVAEFGMETPLLWLVEPRAGTVWSRDGLARVASLTRDVLTIPGVIATDVVSIASPNMRDLRLSDDGLEPIYLMAEVPPDEDAVRALRLRVEGDPSYAGNLITRDGRAAVVVANFRSDADPDAIARAALELRDRYRDSATDVWLVGAPVLAATASAAARGVVMALLLAALAGGAAALAVLGARASFRALLAAGLACTWTVLALLALRALSLPWSAMALPPTALLAAALGLSEQPTIGRSVPVSLALIVGCAGFALVAGTPAAWAGLAMAVGVMFSLAAARAVAPPGRDAAGRLPRRLRTPEVGRVAVAVVIATLALAAFRLPKLSSDYGLVGYGERYLPAPAGDDLRAVARLFPPPSTFVVRLRGESGFVARSDVLRAMSDVGASLRSDPAVRDVQSLADVVKRVNRAFNDDQPEFFSIPDDRGLNARYLALAYSPLFRRFVDRSLSQSALWVLVDGQHEEDLARVRAKLDVQLASHALPGVSIDPLVGDARETLAMADTARGLARGSAAFLLALVIGALLIAGPRAALGVALAAGVSAVAGAGFLGWLGLRLDLLTTGILVCTAVSAGLVALLLASGTARDAVLAIAVALAFASLPLLAWPTAATRVLAIAALAPGSAAALWAIVGWPASRALA